MQHISSRQYKLFKILLDTFLIVLIIDIGYFNLFFKYSLYLTWIIINYIIGYYDNFKNFNLKYFIKKCYLLALNLLLIYSLILFIENIFLNKESHFILKNLLTFYSISLIFQLVLSLIYSKRKKETWINKIDIPLDEILKNDFELIKEDINFLDFQSINKTKHQKHKFSSILFNVEGNIKLENYIKNNKKSNLIQIYEKYLKKIPSRLIKNKDLNYIYPNKNKNYNLLLKRIFDLIFSIALLIVTFPIVIITAIFIKIEDGGPIFYSQIRNGIDNKPYKIYKLRSMIENAEKDGPKWSSANDNRLTKVGKIIRALRIDELPQLFSVIKGEMSLIGPRPERPFFVNDLSKKIPNYYLRSLIKPGLSGWAQVNYSYGSSLLDAENKLSYDIFYVKNFSIPLDLLIFFKTIRIVFTAKGT
tara:strand:- start:887 stop:2137 length:1251 start_codon:yes stop_codon:yes gene_type:complete